jgi:hypothetical protein
LPRKGSATNREPEMATPEAEDTTAVFRRAMWQATEQALRYDLDQAVLEAVFNVLEAAAQARDRAAGDGHGLRPQQPAC